MVALRSILGSPKTDYNTNRASTPVYPPQQYQAQPQQQQTQAARPYQKNEGGKINNDTNIKN